MSAEHVEAMSPPGVGVDLVGVAAFRARLEGRDGLLGSVFREAELAYCLAQARPWMHLAARFAAKEAALKALGSGLAGAMSWQDIEITRDEAGVPGLVFHGAVAERFARAGLRPASVSLSHTTDHAIAVVWLVPAS
ncbi:MAG TPA: holo-ACP synthase [Methylomirabilota bacterium]|jgi:holo-[acyl-carrier protein] synthase|nr:holo-ACP synthase [Methylomirabilota bacterium]